MDVGEAARQEVFSVGPTNGSSESSASTQTKALEGNV